MAKQVAVIGATGGIGQAVVAGYAERDDVERVWAFSRKPIAVSDAKITPIALDAVDEGAVSAAVAQIDVELDILFIAIGKLHDGQMMPEKSLRHINVEQMSSIFAINTFAPTLLMKYFLPKIAKNRRTVCATLSARVGSISDNRLGGWYSYRASKAALNMIIKCASIEYARIRPQSIIVGLHPGTVDTRLSQPFQSNVPSGKLFSPSYSGEQLINVMDRLSVDDTGCVFDYAGQLIAP